MLNFIRTGILVFLLLEAIGASAQINRSASFNDTMLLRLLPVNGLILEGGSGLNNVRLRLDNNAPGGHDFIFQATAQGSPAGPGKLVIGDLTGNAARLTIDSAGRVGLNTLNPDPAALLDINGTAGGLLLPRLTTAETDALPTIPDGMLFYDETLNRFMGAFNDTMLAFSQHWQQNGDAIFIDTFMVKQVGIGATNPHPSALLEIRGNGGLLLPRLTTSERMAIANLPDGMLLYDKTLDRFMGVFNDTILAFSQHWQQNGDAIFIDTFMVKQVGIGTSNPHPSTLLDIKGTNGGVRLPRLTETQIGGLPSLPDGLMFYNKTLDRFVGAWNDTMLVFSQHWRENGNSLYLDPQLADSLGVGTTTPEAKLHVGGDLIVSDLANPGGQMLGVDASGRLGIFNDTILISVSPLDFRSNGEIVQAFGTFGVGVTMGTGAGEMWAPVDIGHRIFNDTILFTFVDGSTNNITFDYVKVSHDSPSVTTVASHTTSGNVPGVVRSFALAIPGAEISDLAEYSYYLKVSSGGWNTGLSVRACYLRGRRLYD